MNKIKLFEDFSANTEIMLFKEKDYHNISDLFQEYADDYRMVELVKGNTKRSDIYFKCEIGYNPYFFDLNIWITDGVESKGNEIIKKMKTEFIPRLEKFGYILVGEIQIMEDDWIEVGGFVRSAYMISLTFRKINT